MRGWLGKFSLVDYDMIDSAGPVPWQEVLVNPL